MGANHGALLRGLGGTRSSPLFQGKFGRMFRALPTARFGKDDAANTQALEKLGAAMSAGFDNPKDGRDAEESGIPALYTYLGQFIDHDITFDPASSLQKQNDPDALIDFRTPALDLDNVYGRGPDDQPYLYDGATNKFLLGSAIGGGGDAAAVDLQRNSRGRALIGDPRNDENSIVSQLQGLFLRFHNRMVDTFPGKSFAEIQTLVRFHYQYVVVNDFLARIVHKDVLADLRNKGRYEADRLEFFNWRNDPFMPVEFAVAAYRLGHSMVRPGYRLNDAVMLPIFPVPTQGLNEGLTGFRAMNPAWGIDWGRFIDLDQRAYDGDDAAKQRRLQFAYRIDTSLVNPLAFLPAAVASNPSSLAARNLLRGWRLGLPSGQDVARAMGIRPLKDSDILIGKAADPEENEPLTRITAIDKVFAGNCPLWTYVLAEAMHFSSKVKVPVIEDIAITTPQLGPVGGRIVAEVILGLLFGDPHSYLSQDPSWKPAGASFTLKDFVAMALGK